MAERESFEFFLRLGSLPNSQTVTNRTDSLSAKFVIVEKIVLERRSFTF